MAIYCRAVLLGISLAVSLPAWTQPQHPFELTKKINIQAQAMYAAPNNDLFVVTPDQSVIKYNAAGDSIGRFHYQKRGSITSVSANNPLATTIWIADYRTVIFLDRQLNTVSEVYINDSEGAVSLVCGSGQNTLWIYSASDMQLRQLDTDGHKLIETAPLTHYLSDDADLCALFADNYHIYLMSSTTLYIFDPQGNFQRTIPIGKYGTNCQFSVRDQSFYYYGNGHLFAWESNADQPVYVPTPPTETKTIDVIPAPGRRSVLTTKGIEIWEQH